MPDPNPAPANPASPVDPAANPANPAAAANPAAPANPEANPANPAPAANPSAPAAASWPENWRNLYAGDDSKKLARLERFTDPVKAFDALIEAQNKIRSGELAKPLPPNATEQERAEWRQANGIPEKPEGYFEKLPDGLVIGKDDQPLFTEFAKVMHDQNVSPAAVQQVVKWYYDLQDKQVAATQQADTQHSREAVDKLREQWGNDYRANMGQVTSLLDGLGGDLKNQFMDATLPDGRRLFNSPEFVTWMAGLAREINPAGVLIPASGGDQIKSIEAELNALKAKMANRNSDYWKGPTANKQQERYRQLIEAQQKLKSRAA
jgi:hypothetical protein